MHAFFARRPAAVKRRSAATPIAAWPDRQGPRTDPFATHRQPLSRHTETMRAMPDVAAAPQGLPERCRPAKARRRRRFGDKSRPHLRLNFAAPAAQSVGQRIAQSAGWLAMGAWGIGLYSGDFAQDLKATIAAVCRLPLDEEPLVDAICRSEPAAATDPANEDHTIFWLVLADQFEQRRIFSERVREMALAVIDGGRDAALMHALGMPAADLRKRAAKLAELAARLVAQPEVSAERKTLKAPQPYVFDQYGVYAYPTAGGVPINPYLPAKRFDRTAGNPDGFGSILILDRGRAFEYLAWYTAVRAVEVLPAVPDRDTLVGSVRWVAPFYGTCNSAHFRKMGLTEVAVFRLDPARVDHFFPHRAQGTVYAVKDISIVNRMTIDAHEPRHFWRRPNGRSEPIVYPPAPNLLELGSAGAERSG